MTNLREKAREIKAAGEAERGNFEPSGVPLRMYNYWLDHSNSKRANSIKYKGMRENFCHFWRVVAIWAPLMFLGKKASKVAPVAGAIVGVGALIALITACIMSNNALVLVLQVAATLVVIMATAAGILGGVSLAQENDETRTRYDLLGFKGALICSLIGFWAAVPFYILTRAVKFYGKNLKQHTGKILIGVAALALLTTYILIAIASGPTTLGVVVAANIGAALVGFGGARLLGRYIDYLAGKRKIEREAYEKALEAYYMGEGPNPRAEQAKEPGRLAKFFSGLGDFIILIAQVIRVNKWKICPMVEID